MRRVVYILPVILIVLITLGYGGWQLWYAPPELPRPVPAPETEAQKPTPTVQVPEGWKVYENQFYGYLIRYPETIRLSAGDLEFVAFYGGNVRPTGGLPPKSAIKISISPFTNISQATVDEWVKTFGPRYQQEGVMTVAGERAIYGKWDVGTDTNPEDDIFVPSGEFGGDVRVIYNGIGYQIAYAPYDSDWKPVFEQMLATFEFTK